MARLTEINHDHIIAYGDDDITQASQAVFRETFGPDTESLLVFNGTAANVLSLKGMVRSHEAVFCTEVSHLLVDECGAPEHYVGCKLVPLPSKHGKLMPATIEEHIARDRGIVHRNQPRAISLSQATERGAVYRTDELADICKLAHAHDLLVHMDGARLANAAVALDTDLAALTRDVGIDVLSFGGTKNGLMMAEALVVLNPALRAAYPFIRKQGMQLASKHRFLAAQFLAYFDGELWRRNASQANAMARHLGEQLAGIEQVRLSAPVEINMVFARFPAAWVAPLQHLTPFLVEHREHEAEARFVTSFDTTAADVDQFIREIKRLSQQEVQA